MFNPRSKFVNEASWTYIRPVLASVSKFTTVWKLKNFKAELWTNKSIEVSQRHSPSLCHVIGKGTFALDGQQTAAFLVVIIEGKIGWLHSTETTVALLEDDIATTRLTPLCCLGSR